MRSMCNTNVVGFFCTGVRLGFHPERSPAVVRPRVLQLLKGRGCWFRSSRLGKLELFLLLYCRLGVRQFVLVSNRRLGGLDLFLGLDLRLGGLEFLLEFLNLGVR